MLCKRHSFSDGILCIFEKMGRFMDLLQYHHEKQDYGQMMDLCRIYGEQYPELWKETLVLLTKADVVNEDMLKDTIQEIDRLNLLAPLQIIQILSTNEKITLGLVKEFITRKIRKEKAAIEEVSLVTG